MIGYIQFSVTPVDIEANFLNYKATVVYVKVKLVTGTQLSIQLFQLIVQSCSLQTRKVYDIV